MECHRYCLFLLYSVEFFVVFAALAIQNCCIAWTWQFFQHEMCCYFSVFDGDGDGYGDSCLRWWMATGWLLRGRIGDGDEMRAVGMVGDGYKYLSICSFLVHSDLISPTSMERGLHSSCPQDTITTTELWLPTNLNHANTQQNIRTHRQKLFVLSHYSTTMSLNFSDQFAFRPTGSTIAARWSVIQQSICYSSSSRFQQSFWFSPSIHTSTKDSHARYPWHRIQRLVDFFFDRKHYTR